MRIFATATHIKCESGLWRCFSAAGVAGRSADDAFDAAGAQDVGLFVVIEDVAEITPERDKDWERRCLRFHAHMTAMILRRLIFHIAIVLLVRVARLHRSAVPRLTPAAYRRTLRLLEIRITIGDSPKRRVLWFAEWHGRVALVAQNQIRFSARGDNTVAIGAEGGGIEWLIECQSREAAANACTTSRSARRYGMYQKDIAARSCQPQKVPR